MQIHNKVNSNHKQSNINPLPRGAEVLPGGSPGTKPETFWASQAISFVLMFLLTFCEFYYDVGCGIWL